MKGKKTGGRVQGATNRITSDLRAKIQSIIENNIDRVQTDLDTLEAKDRLQIIEKLLSYCVPKLQAQTVNVDFESLSDAQLEQIINSINITDDGNN